jgi:hypothetical protein
MTLVFIHDSQSVCLTNVFVRRVGRPEACEQQDIILSGTHIYPQHCQIENISNEHVVLRPCSVNTLCYVNGKKVDDLCALKSADRVIFGRSHVFRFNNPEQVRKEKKTTTTTTTSPLSSSSGMCETQAGLCFAQTKSYTCRLLCLV